MDRSQSQDSKVHGPNPPRTGRSSARRDDEHVHHRNKRKTSTSSETENNLLSRAFSRERRGRWLSFAVPVGGQSKEVVAEMVVRNTGLDVKAPKTGCNDPLCPFHGHLSIRGRVFEGIVAGSRSPKTVSVERAYLHYYTNYSRTESRRINTPAHNHPYLSAAT